MAAIFCSSSHADAGSLNFHLNLGLPCNLLGLIENGRSDVGGFQHLGLKTFSFHSQPVGT